MTDPLPRYTRYTMVGRHVAEQDAVGIWMRHSDHTLIVGELMRRLKELEEAAVNYMNCEEDKGRRLEARLRLIRALPPVPADPNVSTGESKPRGKRKARKRL